MNFWREHVTAIERDGWVSSEYARMHGLSATALYYWRSKFRAMTVAAARPSKFITLNVVPTQKAESSIDCVLMIGAVRIELSTLPAPEWLAALDAAVQRAR